MGKFIREPEWLSIIEDQEQRLRFDSFNREIALDIGLRILRLNEEKYHGNLSCAIMEDDLVIFSYMMPGTTIENSAWMFRKRNVSKATGLSSLRAYLEIEDGLREETWRGREEAFVACGGCFPVLMNKGDTYAYITVSGLEHHEDHQIIADAIAEHLNVSIGSIV
jgi:uncharacterized protein (UPF0303 family)